jgi:hypothetical protein
LNVRLNVQVVAVQHDKGWKSLKTGLKIFVMLCLLAFTLSRAAAQDLVPPQSLETKELTANRKLFTEVSSGLRAMREGPDGRIYLLVSPQPGVLVFEASGKPLMQIGAALSSIAGVKTRPAGITFGEDCDVDSEGRIYVADRGANAVLVFSKEGMLLRAIPVVAPVSLAALPDGEVAVTTWRDPHLILVFDKNGRDVREFGEPEPLSDRDDLNRYLSTGLLATDAQSHLFYAFPYMPEPTIRQYDRFGFAGQEIAYSPIDALQVAQATRKEIQRQENRREPPLLKRNLTAITVDRSSGEVWVALHHALLQFDKDGNGTASYLLYTPQGSPLEVTSLLVNKERILIGSESLGVYEFLRPAKHENLKTEKDNDNRSAEKKVSP